MSLRPDAMKKIYYMESVLGHMKEKYKKLESKTTYEGTDSFDFLLKGYKMAIEDTEEYIKFIKFIYNI